MTPRSLAKPRSPAQPQQRLDWRALLRDAEVKPVRVLLSVGAGTMALGSAVGLAAVAAWMIAKAAGMPSPAELGLAAVAVRFFGIARGLFRYLERLVSHETALGGVVALRTRTYEGVARTGASRVLGLRRGDIVARMGGDIDAMGDAVVRSLIPLGVAGTVSLLSIAITTAYLPVAGATLAGCLVAAAVLSGLMTWRSARTAAHAGTAAAARVSTATLEAIDGAAEHRVWGTSGAAADELRAADLDAEDAAELSARPAAWAAASLQAAQGAALVLALWLAVSAARHAGLPPTDTAVVTLLPLAAFEAVSAVPAAVQQAFRSAVAARRVQAMVGGAEPEGAMARGAVEGAPGLAASDAPVPATAPLRLEGLSAAWPGMLPTVPVTATIEPGGALGIVGRTGIGKTTLLLTIAGALAPAQGKALVGGAPVGPDTVGRVVAMTPEDAHLFGTTLLENLRVADGAVTEHQARAALEAVQLGPWLDSLPAGLDTRLGSGGNTVSGGERRRLLLARAVLCPAPIHLIDEPAEHLDADGIDALRALVAAMRRQGKSVVIVTHDLGILDVVDRVVSLDGS
ncbi:thiol reductant ABC exporter subunit CydC [Demequina sp.]|uniref:thiol reductant ABC exporter subunit CydC n=1 Tax=Demequina sp. TaxID=2050685 RepID=UPI0025BBB6E3|nr:thiol reductant ABC exporter subunit CydC [Demequina sp.]